MANTNSTKGNTKVAQDKNAVVTAGSLIKTSVVTEKRQQAVVLKYNFNGTECTGVMHVSQFPSLERNVRDQMFSEVCVGATFSDLEASIEPADKTQGRRFTSVRLSGRSPMEKAAELKRQQYQAERQNRESAYADAVNAIDGKVVKATVKKLAFSKDPQSKQETDHCYGAFLNCVVNDVNVSGLLHTSRMLGKNRVDRLVEASTTECVLEVVATKTDKGIAFSEDVQPAKEAAAQAERDQRQATERESFIGLVREALANGSAEKLQFPAKVTVNRLDSNGGVSCEACGVAIEVSSDDLGISPKNMRGVGHQVKLVPTGEKDGVISAKRYVKSK